MNTKMMQQFEQIDNLAVSCSPISDYELMQIEGGSWPGEGLVKAAFEIGRETGRAIRNWVQRGG